MRTLLFILVSLMILVSACNEDTTPAVSNRDKAVQNSAIVTRMAGSHDGAMSPEEQKARAYDLFGEILELVQTNKREDVEPQIEGLYLEIINTCPDVGLAQEAYWKVLSMYLKDSTPESQAKAENLYAQFLERYPDSVMKGRLAQMMAEK